VTEQAGTMTTPTWSTPRVTADNWRTICPCQKHSRRRLRLKGSKRRIFLFAGSLLLVGASVPLDALETAVRTTQEQAAIESATAARRGAIPFVEPVASAFTGTVELPSPLRIERVRREFFRTQIPYGEIIYREARKHGLEPELVAAVIQTESDFRPRLVSPKDAQGLMQVLPSTAQFMGFGDPMDPVQNIRAGTGYLKYLEEEFDDPAMMLAAYNAGPTRVKRLGAIPPFRETRDYVRKVERSKKRFQREIAERLTALR
jgi:soluble lytic murein transglycosylase-like protein